MTVFFPSHSIQIYRQRRKGTSNRYGMSATGTIWQADIQPASTTRQETINERFGAVFTAFVDVDCDIKEGDRVQTEDGQVYSVQGVAPWRGAGLLDHKELVLVSQDAGNG